MVIVAGWAVLALADAVSAYYSPRLGRFISRDAIDEPGAVLVRYISASTSFLPRDPVAEPNAFLSFKNSPLSWFDPDGLAPATQPATQPVEPPYTSRYPDVEAKIRKYCNSLTHCKHDECISDAKLLADQYGDYVARNKPPVSGWAGNGMKSAVCCLNGIAAFADWFTPGDTYPPLPQPFMSCTDWCYGLKVVLGAVKTKCLKPECYHKTTFHYVCGIGDGTGPAIALDPWGTGTPSVAPW